jgi:hypothetical protein
MQDVYNMKKQKNCFGIDCLWLSESLFNCGKFLLELHILPSNFFSFLLFTSISKESWLNMKSRTSLLKSSLSAWNAYTKYNWRAINFYFASIRQFDFTTKEFVPFYTTGSCCFSTETVVSTSTRGGCKARQTSMYRGVTTCPVEKTMRYYNELLLNISVISQ